MRIRVTSGGKNIHLVLPTKLLFSAPTAWIASTVGRKFAPETMDSIPPEALKAVFRELRKVKDRYGSWDLVDVQSANGEHVKVQL